VAVNLGTALETALQTGLEAALATELQTALATALTIAPALRMPETGPTGRHTPPAQQRGRE
jgi:hypothetical protein